MKSERWLFSVFINIIDTKQRACEGGDLSEADEEGLVDLSLRVNEDTAEEHDQSSKGEDSGSEELYVAVVVHRFLNCSAKVVQKNGTTKKAVPQSISKK